MKRLIPYLTVLSFAFTNAIFATTPTQDAPKDVGPDIKVSALYNNVTRAKFTRPHSERHHHLTYKQGIVLGTYKHKLESDRKLKFGLGYMGTEFHFSHHPRTTSFKERHFDNLLVQLGASTKELERWKWDAELGMQINTEHFHLSRYTFFSGMLHGRHDWRENCHLHVGILGFSGMRYSRMLPIIGFDYKFSNKWKLNAVFPLNTSIVYSITEQLALDAGIRFMLSRQRLGDSGHYKRGLVAYTNWGAEVGLNYALNQYVRFNVHLGESFAGRMRISTKHDHHRKHLRLDPALYYGLSASIAF